MTDKEDCVERILQQFDVTQEQAEDIYHETMRQKSIARTELLDELISRLSTCSHERALFPLAGQDFRNKIIKMLNYVKSEVR